MILYLSHGRIPTRIVDGGQLRFYSLACAVSKTPGHMIVTAFIRTRFSILNFPMLRFVVLVLRVLFGKRNTILLSYPNFPFFPREIEEPVGLSTVLILLLQFLKRLKGFRVVVDVDDLVSLGVATDTRTTGIRERRGRVNKSHIVRFETLLFRLGDVIWTVTQNEADYIRQHYAVDRNKFRLVPNGNLRLALTPRTLPQNKVKFVYAGTLYKDRDKDAIKKLITIFEKQSDPQLELYIMGLGGDWILQHSHSYNVRYLGSLTHEEAERYVKACDVGLLLYTAEDKYVDIAFPAKLALYVTSELPVLSLDSPGIKSFITGNRIGLVTTWGELHTALAQIATQPSLRVQMKINCRRIKQDYYSDVIFERALKASV